MPQIDTVVDSPSRLSALYPPGNAAYQWDLFNPEQYFEDNYKELHEDDRRILQLVRNYFDSCPFTGWRPSGMRLRCDWFG